jgi:DNA-binding XRE family transcriptional regulator
MGIGDNIRSRREAKGLTLTELAHRCGISKGYLSQIEHNEVDRPSAEVLYRMALYLDTTIAELLGKPTFVPDPRPTISDSLKEFAAREGLTDQEIAELAQVKHRGKQPQTVDDWAFIHRALKAAVGEE